MTATVHPMADYASEVPRIAAWFFEQWRSLYGDESLASVESRIRTWLTRNQIPTALVAISDDGVIGCGINLLVYVRFACKIDPVDIGFDTQLCPLSDEGKSLK